MQVADRAERLALDDGGRVDVLCENSMDTILEVLHERKPKLAIIDSIQTISLADVVGSNGSVSQVFHSSCDCLRLLCPATYGFGVRCMQTAKQPLGGPQEVCMHSGERVRQGLSHGVQADAWNSSVFGGAHHEGWGLSGAENSRAYCGHYPVPRRRRELAL